MNSNFIFVFFFVFQLFRSSIADDINQNEEILLSRQKRAICISGQRCYDELNECFPCHFGFQAESPQEINMIFYLYTPEKQGNPYQFIWGEYQAGVNLTNLNISRDLWVIIHGFEGQWPLEWLDIMRQAFISKGRNVLVARWTDGTHYPQNYALASANGVVVGAMTAKVVKALQQKHNLDLDNVCITGFSLGAPLAGHTGARLNGQAKMIVALDHPAQLYDDQPPEFRLDPTDAKLVQAIHTNGASLLKGGLGTMIPKGHIDIYVNGGELQPGCPVSERNDYDIKDFYSIIKILGCNHLRAPALLTDSVLNTDCQYTCYPCASKRDWDNGVCFQDCSQGGCVKLGNQMDPRTTLRGKFFLATEIDQGVNRPDVAYCATQYWVHLIPDRKVKGEIKISLKQAQKTTRYPAIFQSKSDFMDSDVGRSRVLAANLEPDSITLEYNRYNILISQGTERWNLLKVEVVREDQTGFVFNGTAEIIDDYPSQILLSPDRVNYDAKLNEIRTAIANSSASLPFSALTIGTLNLVLLQLMWMR